MSSLASLVIASISNSTFLTSLVEAFAIAAGIDPALITALIPPSSISKMVGTETVPTGGTLSTAGGDPFYIGNIMSIATVDLSEIMILIGYRNCTNLTKTLDGDLSSQYGVPPDSPLAVQYKTYRIDCLTPPGAGKGVPIIVVVPGGQSRVNDQFLFSYAPPSISDAVDVVYPTVSYLSPKINGVSLNGIPTVGTDIILKGQNFGAANVPLLDPAEVEITLAADSLDLSARRLIKVPVSNWTHTRLVFTMPPGQGKVVKLRFIVAGQTTTDPLSDGSVRTADTVRYRAPQVTSIIPQLEPTLGGSVLLVKGTDFGTGDSSSSIEAGKPIVTLGGKPCELPTWYTHSENHTILYCILPEGQGKNLPVLVTVAAQTSSSTALSTYTYAPPIIFNISHKSGPTSGLDRFGNSIIMTLDGMNLGIVGSIEFRPVYVEENLPVVTIPHSAMLFHNHTRMVFPMPEGAGRLLMVHVVLNGQESTEEIFFSYDPPSVISTQQRYDKAISDCTPRSKEILSRNGTVIGLKPIPAGCFKTRGGYPILIGGESFGLTLPKVTIGGRTADVIYHSHTQIAVMVPVGLGDNNYVIVTVGGRPSAVTNGSIYAYDPPEISQISPNVPDAFGPLDQRIEFRGINFGFEPTLTLISLGGLACREPTWLNDNLLNCQPPADTVGPKNMSILVANRTEPYIWYTEEEMIIFKCTKGYSGMLGEYCVDCETEPTFRGSFCPGGELDWDKVVSAKGWWRTNVTQDKESQCHPLRVHRAACPIFQPCEPVESCLGSNKCAEGYTAARCAECIQGKYYRVNGECIKCPDSPWALFIMFVLVALAALGGAFIMHKKNISLALISIGLDYFQIVAMFARTRIRWPPLIKQLFLLMSAFNFNLEIVAPECAIPEVTYAGKWLFIEGLPVFGWLILFSAGGVYYLYKRFCVNRKKLGLLNTHWSSIVATSIVVLRVLYIYITRTTFDVFNCAPTTPPEIKNGVVVEYMAWNLSIVCYEPGGTHVFLLPFAFAALAVYVGGAPLFSVYKLWKNKEKVKYDQILRALNKGDSTLENPYYEFRQTWSKLYYHFLPGKWYWEFVITMKKFLIAFTSLMFRQTPSYQLALALLILFVMYVIHMLHFPYMSHTARSVVHREHIRKLSEGNEIHLRIAKKMKEAEQKNQRKRAKVQQLGIDKKEEEKKFQDHLHVTQQLVAQYPGLARFFDYNTVEAFMLSSAILINLAGIMFDSSRFSGDNLLYPQYAKEYESLSYSVGVLIFGSTLYLLFVFLIDVYIVCTPRSALLCLGKASSTLRRRPKPVPIPPKPIDPSAEDSTKLIEYTNPFFEHKSKKNIDDTLKPESTTTNNETSTDSTVPVDSAVDPVTQGPAEIMDVDDILARITPPTESEWNIVKANYIRLKKNNANPTVSTENKDNVKLNIKDDEDEDNSDDNYTDAEEGPSDEGISEETSSRRKLLNLPPIFGGTGIGDLSKKTDNKILSSMGQTKAEDDKFEQVNPMRKAMQDKADEAKRKAEEANRKTTTTTSDIEFSTGQNKTDDKFEQVNPMIARQRKAEELKRHISESSDEENYASAEEDVKPRETGVTNRDTRASDAGSVDDLAVAPASTESVASKFEAVASKFKKNFTIKQSNSTGGNKSNAWIKPKEVKTETENTTNVSPPSSKDTDSPDNFMYSNPMNQSRVTDARRTLTAAPLSYEPTSTTTGTNNVKPVVPPSPTSSDTSPSIVSSTIPEPQVARSSSNNRGNESRFDNPLRAGKQSTIPLLPKHPPSTPAAVEKRRNLHQERTEEISHASANLPGEEPKNSNRDTIHKADKFVNIIMEAEEEKARENGTPLSKNPLVVPPPSPIAKAVQEAVDLSDLSKLFGLGPAHSSSDSTSRITAESILNRTDLKLTVNTSDAQSVEGISPSQLPTTANVVSSGANKGHRTVPRRHANLANVRSMPTGSHTSDTISASNIHDSAVDDGHHEANSLHVPDVSESKTEQVSESKTEQVSESKVENSSETKADSA